MHVYTLLRKYEFVIDYQASLLEHKDAHVHPPATKKAFQKNSEIEG